LRKDVFVCQNASFGNFNFIWESLASLLQGFDSSKDCINLECEAPSSRLFIVLLEDINIFSAQILPLRDRFLYPFSLGELLLKYGQEGRFSAANIAFNSEAIVDDAFRIGGRLRGYFAVEFELGGHQVIFY